MITERQTAYKLRVGDILKGHPIIENERLNFLELGDKKIIRVNVVANIIDKFESEGDKKFASFTIDDASGQVNIKFFGNDVDKFKETGLTPIEAKKIRAKLIQECPVNLECKVIHEISPPEGFQGTHTWFIGSVEAAYIDENYDKTQALLYWQKKYRLVSEPFYTTKL